MIPQPNNAISTIAKRHLQTCSFIEYWTSSGMEDNSIRMYFIIDVVVCVLAVFAVLMWTRFLFSARISFRRTNFFVATVLFFCFIFMVLVIALVLREALFDMYRYELRFLKDLCTTPAGLWRQCLVVCGDPVNITETGGAHATVLGFSKNILLILIAECLLCIVACRVIRYFTAAIPNSRRVRRQELPDLDSADCVICLDSIWVYAALELYCGHVFHKYCIEEWADVTNFPSCPTCRVSL